MNQKQNDNIKRLLTLARFGADFDCIDLSTIDAFNSLREELGLPQLLLLIEEYAQNKTRTPSHQTTN